MYDTTPLIETGVAPLPASAPAGGVCESSHPGDPGHITHCDRHVQLAAIALSTFIGVACILVMSWGVGARAAPSLGGIGAESSSAPAAAAGRGTGGGGPPPHRLGGAPASARNRYALLVEAGRGRVAVGRCGDLVHMLPARTSKRPAGQPHLTCNGRPLTHAQARRVWAQHLVAQAARGSAAAAAALAGAKPGARAGWRQPRRGARTHTWREHVVPAARALRWALRGAQGRIHASTAPTDEPQRLPPLKEGTRCLPADARGGCVRRRDATVQPASTRGGTTACARAAHSGGGPAHPSHSQLRAPGRGAGAQRGRGTRAQGRAARGRCTTGARLGAQEARDSPAVLRAAGSAALHTARIQRAARRTCDHWARSSCVLVYQLGGGRHI